MIANRRCWMGAAAVCLTWAATNLSGLPGEFTLGLLVATAVPLALLGMVTTESTAARVRAERVLGADGTPKGFSLAYRTEVIQLEPKKAWHQVDHFKWVTRGVIEEPQSFHVHPDGSVDINGETILVSEPDGAARLEAEINKRHLLVPPEKPRAAVPREAPATDRSVFRVRLDHLGHLQIECRHGTERVETGLRGLATLIQNGLMLPARQLHVDPLQRYVDLDGTRFDVTPEGAAALEDTLNRRYAARVGGTGGVAIEIKENAGSATGFDIHFVTIRAGAKFEIKGHLSQENLDILQDPAKCDLLRPEIVLKLSPPFLFIRRRRPDGGEEPIPEFPDLRYRSLTAAKLQGILNHPLLRRGNTIPATGDGDQAEVADLVSLRVTRNPENRRFLWLEGRTTAGGPPFGRALTHHNVTDLQHAGAFRPELDVSLSLDHQTLSILNQQTGEEQKLTLNWQSDDAELARAGELLTAALKPPRPFVPKVKAESRPAASPPSALSPSPSDDRDRKGADATGEPPPPAQGTTTNLRSGNLNPEASPAPTPPAAHPVADVAARAPTPAPAAQPPAGPVVAPPSPPPRPTPEVVTPDNAAGLARPPLTTAPPVVEPDPLPALLFRETDGLRVNDEIFRRLGPFFCLPVQTVRLSLPHVFTDRLFEIISFEDQEIVTLFDLRSEGFYGFYRAHINPRNVVLVYACKGLHVEFGPERCMIELSLGAEPHEFRGSGLLGFAQDRDRHEVFVVTPAFKTWVKPHERACEAAFAHFITPREYAASAERYHLVWPEPPPTDAARA